MDVSARSIWALVGAAVLAATPSAQGEEPPKTGVVLVVTDVAATCEFAEGPSGPSPLVARLAPGPFTVSCAIEVAGVKVTKGASGQLAAGQSQRIEIAFDSKAGRS